MARRKNVKRLDPRYFLNETVNRREEELEEGEESDGEVSADAQSVEAIEASQKARAENEDRLRETIREIIKELS